MLPILEDMFLKSYHSTVGDSYRNLSPHSSVSLYVMASHISRRTIAGRPTPRPFPAHMWRTSPEMKASAVAQRLSARRIRQPKTATPGGPPPEPRGWCSGPGPRPHERTPAAPGHRPGSRDSSPGSTSPRSASTGHTAA